MLHVQLFYVDSSSGDELEIAAVSNHNFYDWTVPEELGTMEKIEVIIPNTDALDVYEQPSLRIVPDLSTMVVTPSDVVVLNKGYFVTKQDYAEGYMTYTSQKSGELEEIPVKLNLANGQIDLSNPIEFEPFVYLNKIEKREISVKLVDVTNGHEYVMSPVYII